MSTPSSTASTASTAPVPARGATAAVALPADGSTLNTPQGRTSIADGVVAKVAGLAAREVDGVHGFGGGAARALGALTERIPGGRSSSSRGVSVEVGERQAAVDITVVVEYGVSIAELARAIRRNVIGAVEQMTGLEVVEVDVTVVDLHIPSDGDADDQGADTTASARVR
ncbi:Asp23/Gls24 family envelope stress response protein [Actinomycetospora lemnae]|uniref:Asp23/Gls24 family envelope stress response protein n=1 Tax=Actinomycetospora lemnae TaxID=3019891 RepID=A0ABT5SRK6_9PSEU|nr:Asp23/Gls24 family envelope stress response protein [Actinomycetospora sp. DW7H6]MDD7965419.1 Asp23/Gls24 family envelope stress response protein [Actinomycetospora sp. DW7H6]